VKVRFTEEGLEQYIYWQSQDRKTLAKINKLIQDIQRNGLSVGIGKPEPLKHMKGFSRRIDDANRLVYAGIEGDSSTFEIISCIGHYE
jgi:toxin YoeB